MSLLQLWRGNPAAFSGYSIEQVVKFAGDGHLRDNSICSQEFRAYLAEIESQKLAVYANYCLAHSFDRSGAVLQDVVNELGRRLEYKVINGRYQGVQSAIGYDGIWQSPEGQTLVVEVKTTDAYRISLETLANYRRRLIEAAEVQEPSSILIIVGRQDTGELEAQVRGSRYAWDIRLMSIEALIKLININQSLDARETGRKIRELLIPREFTKLDGLIDVVFETARDVEKAVEIETRGELVAEADVSSENISADGASGYTDPQLLQAKRDAILTRFGMSFSGGLIRKSRALYWTPGRDVRVACTISKRYARTGQPYWYAYHPDWDEFLGQGQAGYLVLGCMDQNLAFAIPLNIIRSHLDVLNVTTRGDGKIYWHLYIGEEQGQYYLVLPKDSKWLALEPYYFCY